MKKAPSQQHAGKIQTRAASQGGRLGAWVQLPQSVVEARAGLIPSEKTDSTPPPEDLTSKEMLAWHQGLPVFLSAERFLAYLTTARFSAWRRSLPVFLDVDPARRCVDTQTTAK